MANRYDTNQKLQEIADNLGANSGLIDALEDIKTAIDNGGGGGGGTTVIANPSGQPTDTLNTIQIGSTVYDINGGSPELDLVPRLTSNTIVGIGTASDNDALSPAWLPWHAFATETEFDASINGGYWATTSADGYIQFTFDNPVTINKIAFGVYNSCTFLVQYSSDGTTFTDGQTISRTGPDSGYICHNELTTLSQPIDCIAIRLKATSASSHNLGAVHFYGTWKDTLSADDVDYDNTTSGLTATNVQDAIDENASSIDTLNSKLTTTSNTLQTNEILYKYGNVRVLAINGATTDSTGKLTTIPSDDRPTGNIVVQTVILDASNKLYNGYLTIDNNGLVSIRYYVAQSTTDAAVGANHRIYTSASWVV